MRTFSNTSPNSATTSQSSPYHSHFLRSSFALISNVAFQHLIPTFTFYPARTDHIDLHPNSDVNRVLRSGNTSCHLGQFYGRHIYRNFTYEEAVLLRRSGTSVDKFAFDILCESQKDNFVFNILCKYLNLSIMLLSNEFSMSFASKIVFV